MTRAAESIHHPAPDRHHARPSLLMFTIFGAPLSWFLMLNVGYIATSNSCFEESGLRPIAPLDSYPIEILIIAATLLVSLAMTVAAIWLAVQLLRKTEDEVEGGHRHLLEIGGGRTRFLAIWGLLTSVSFGILILINAFALVVVPPCSG